VSSFGFGGANSHIVIDDAYHYLTAAGLQGNHNTRVHHGIPSSFEPTVEESCASSQGDEILDNSFPAFNPPRLSVLSANDKTALAQQVNRHSLNLRETASRNSINDVFLGNFTYTLNERRTLHSWRAAATLNNSKDLRSLQTIISRPQRSSKDPSLCLVFTGQGPQYPAEQLQCLEQFEIFRKCLDDAEDYLLELGCSWRVRDEHYRSKRSSRISDAEFSQPLSTIVKVALVELLRSFGVYPSVAVGHSLGEIVAAYCVRALSARSAI
jgi:acyl transferase domain-containing protein